MSQQKGDWSTRFGAAGAGNIVRLWGLCGGCLLRIDDVKEVQPRHVYQRVVRFYEGRLAITAAMCAECWRLLYELRQVDVGLHHLELPAYCHRCSLADPEHTAECIDAQAKEALTR